MKTNGLLEFGPFRADLGARVLTHDGQVVPLPPKAFDVLAALATCGGSGMTREELISAVWGDSIVEEGNLTQAFSLLRKALGDDAQSPQYVVTIPRRGYRLEAAVRDVQLNGQAQPSAAEPPDKSDPQVRVPVIGRQGLIWASLAGAAILAMAGLWIAARPKPRAAIRSVVILPFVNLSANADQEYISDGLTEEIINALAVTPGLKVVARTSAFQFKGKNADVRTIGTTLGADAVLEGSVRLDRNRLRVTAQLNSSRDGYHYWSRTWEYPLQDVFGVEQEVARQVVETLRQGSPMPLPQVKPLTHSLEAHSVYLRGQYFKHAIIEGKLSQALDSFEKALQIDPRFAAAHAAIGQTYIWALLNSRISTAEALPLIRQHVRRALELDPDLAMGHAVQADLSFYWDWDFAAAERSFRRALELNKGDPDARHEYTHFLDAMGRFKESDAEAMRVAEIDPVSIDALTLLQYHFYMAHDTARAVSAAETALTVAPGRVDNLQILQWTYASSGQFQNAIETAARRRDLAPEAVEALRGGFKEGGESGYWKAAYKSDLHQSMDQGQRAWRLGGYYARLGQPTEALRWAEKAVDLHTISAVNLNITPEYDRVRGLPEFKRIVRRVGLPER
jgi:serine/threonine-protein kinase